MLSTHRPLSNMNNPTAKQAAIDAMKHDVDIAAEAEDLSEVVKGLSANASRATCIDLLLMIVISVFFC